MNWSHGRASLSITQSKNTGYVTPSWSNFSCQVILVTKLLFQVDTQSRHPLTSLVWSKYRPKVKQNNLKNVL